MENNSLTLPSLSPLHSPTNLSKVLSLSPSLPQPSATFHASLPLSPPYPSLKSSEGPSSHCLSPSTLSDQDDLTCLSWLHQKNLLPLPKIPTLPQLQSLDPPLAPNQSINASPAKPPFSFSSLIFMAIEDSSDKRLPVKGIYEWIVNNFPYYRTAPSGWRNSVRHNLSLSKSFRRIHRDKSQVQRSVGKGSLWCVCPEFRPALLEVLKKTHYYHSSSSSLLNSRTLLEAAEHGQSVIMHPTEISDLDLNNPPLSSNPSCSLIPDHEELVAMESVELAEEACEEQEKDPLADSGYIEFHYYQCQQYQYLVLPGDTELDLETVEILQLDAEAQEAAGSLLDLAGGNH